MWWLIVQLNLWPLLLDLLVIIDALLILTLKLPMPAAIALGLLGLWPLILAIKIHAQTKHKIRAWKLLCLRNKKVLRPESFKVYFAAPCGRALIRAVLGELHRGEHYKELKKKYKTGFWGMPDDGPALVFTPAPEKESP